MHPDKQEIQSDIEAIEKNEALDEEANFVDRAEAIDFIEFHITDRIDGMLRDSKQVENLTELKQRAESLKNRLEEINEKLVQRLRVDIRSGNYTSEDFYQFDKYVGRALRKRKRDEAAYDALDTFVNDLLRIDIALKETKQREPDMIFLQPTPARIVLELVEEAKIVKDDVFYDLGSGLGQVPILIRLLIGAKTKGIEFEPAYCDYAQQCVKRLNLSHVEFMNRDARDADYSDGTIFFMYTPFTGELLQEVLGKLEGESRKRSIKICTYGPCTPHVSNQSWLRRIDQVKQNTDHEYELAIFKSVQK